MSSSQRAVPILAGLIAVVSLVAAGLGVLQGWAGEPWEFDTVFGETVAIQGEGLYRNDTVSLAAQAVGQDLVTLAVGIPLLIFAAAQFRKGKLQGALLLAGILGYFVYTYASYAFLIAFNPLFLAYVALLGLSSFALVLTLQSVDVSDLPDRFSDAAPRRTICVALAVMGVLLLVMWLGRIVPAVVSDNPPEGIESYSTLVIQALDLAFVVPLAFLAAVLLWRRRPWGYLLASIVLIKVAALALAVTAMAMAQMLAGVSVALGEVAVFPVLALVFAGLTAALLRSTTDAMSAAS
jgi:hypothetical protein